MIRELKSDNDGVNGAAGLELLASWLVSAASVQRIVPRKIECKTQFVASPLLSNTAILRCCNLQWTESR